MKKFSLILNQKGQTFVLIVMIMFAALAIGMTVSSRFIKSLKTLIGSDNSAKAVAVAESAIERLLILPSDTLTTYISNNSCGTACTLSITDLNGQQITATVTLSLIGNSSSSYPLTVDEADTAAVTLTGYPTDRSIYVCWNGTTSVSGEYIYSQSGVSKSTPFAFNAVIAYDTNNGFSSSSANFGYQNCLSTGTTDTPVSLRLHSIYGRTEFAVIPEAGYNIPVQGIQIDSIGKAGNATRKVTVIKSSSYAPVYFDYALYQKNANESLSN